MLATLDAAVRLRTLLFLLLGFFTWRALQLLLCLFTQSSFSSVLSFFFWNSVRCGCRSLDFFRKLFDRWGSLDRLCWLLCLYCSSNNGLFHLRVSFTVRSLELLQTIFHYLKQGSHTNCFVSKLFFFWSANFNSRKICTFAFWRWCLQTR